MEPAGPSLINIAPTIAALFGIEPPALSQGPGLQAVLDAARSAGVNGGIERLLIYAPDAIGRRLLVGQPAVLEQVRRFAPVEVQLLSVFPPKTPVCFSSIWTGAPPEVHGIRQYERPVLQCDTIFDALVRAGLQVALAVVADSTNDLMFRGRWLDYFAETYDEQVTERALQLIRDDRHQFILAYHQEYDDQLHRTRPDSPECLSALQRHADSFSQLVSAVESVWGGRPWACVFLPDHGAHFDEGQQCGTHGADIPDDMELLHFWAIKPLV